MKDGIVILSTCMVLTSASVAYTDIANRVTNSLYSISNKMGEITKDVVNQDSTNDAIESMRYELYDIKDDIYTLSKEVEKWQNDR